jgi:hypothetical protein
MIQHYVIVYSKFLQCWKIQKDYNATITGFSSPDDAIECIRFFVDHASITILGYADLGVKDRTIEI